MLINIRISELLNETNNGIPLAIIIGISFNYPIYEILPNNLTNLSLDSLLNTHLYKEFSYYINKQFSNSIDNNIYYVTSKM
jgi:hypothetical protein